MDFLAELGTLGLGSRLRRLSEMFFEETSDVYAFYNFDLEPRYFPLITFLHRYGPVGVTDAAKALHVTHSAISQMTRELLQSDWILTRADSKDERRRLLELSEKGRSLVRELEPIWHEIQGAVDELLGEDAESFMSKVAEIEQALRDIKFAKRVIRRGAPVGSEDLRLCEWDPRFAQAFHDLNEEWVRRFFSYEEKDAEILRDPEKHIRADGGEVFFALWKGKPVGTCALLRTGPKEFELVKMAVSRHCQGQGVGKALLEYALRWAKFQDAEKVSLETNSQLVGALKLYQRTGFSKAERPHQSFYERADVYMECKL